jgi:hypothetical protein
MKTKVKWIDRCLIESPFYIGLCLSKKNFDSEMKRLKIAKKERPQWVNDGYSGRVHQFRNKNKQVIIVCIKRGESQICTMGLIIHEAVHVWQAIKDDLNEQHPSPEFEAYSIQIIAQRLIEKYREKSHD